MAGGVEKISISLTPDLAAILHEAVEKEGYASTSEVIREALREWRAKRVARQQATEEVRRLWDEGIASGSSGFHSVEDIIADARARKAEH
jgi:antitoxin ParD1/3/4